MRFLKPLLPTEPAFRKPDSCRGCVGYTWPDTGFMPAAVGGGQNGVALVGEALGEAESLTGRPFQGKAGLALTQALQRVGLRRDEFLIDNVLRCRPPDNKLNGTPYEQAVINACFRYVQGTLTDPRIRVVVPLGEVAFQRVCGLDKRYKITPARGYVWQTETGKWAVPTFHPSYIMRGNQHLQGTFLGDILRAATIAREGFVPHRFDPTLDPTPERAARWADDYLAALDRDAETLLAYDIETPYKQEEGDEDALDVDDPSFIILRVGFAYREGEALSVPFTAPYEGTIRRLLAAPGNKIVWNASYDRPRLEAAGYEIAGGEIDGMWAWHVLHSDQPKSLGFVAPTYCPDQPAWKHLAKSQPALYNALDAEVELRSTTGILRDLRSEGLWHVFDRHVLQLTPLLRDMGRRGMPVDAERRRELSLAAQAELKRVDALIEETVPLEARQFKVFAALPKPGEERPGLVKVQRLVEWRECPNCKEVEPRKPHFRTFKRPTAKRPQNPCAGLQSVPRTGVREVWARPLPWKPSVKQLTAYAKAKRHRLITVWDRATRTRKVTFNDDALRDLAGMYPADRLYPTVQLRRGVENFLSRYIGYVQPDGSWEGGMPVGPDGCVHTTLGFTPSTGRLSSQAPNLQNIPREDDKAVEGTPEWWLRRVKEIFVAPEGWVFFEADYSAIEAVLVGYDAKSPAYIRLAKLGVHDYLNSHLMHRRGRLAQPADASWPDDQLGPFLAEIKRTFKDTRDAAKRTVHAGNYGQTPKALARQYPNLFPGGEQEAQELQDLYFDVCPDVRRWQNATVELADKEATLINAFGYRHRFWRVKEWEKVDGEWKSEWGEAARAALAFGPQGNAAGVIKEAILTLRDERLAEWLRLQVHDSLLSLFQEQEAERLGQATIEIMRRRGRAQAPPTPGGWGLTSTSESRRRLAEAGRE